MTLISYLSNAHQKAAESISAEPPPTSSLNSVTLASLEHSRAPFRRVPEPANLNLSTTCATAADPIWNVVRTFRRRRGCEEFGESPVGLKIYGDATNRPCNLRIKAQSVWTS